VAIRETFTREEACKELGISPSMFRRLWREYGTYLGQERPPRDLDARTLGLIRVAHRLRLEGRTPEEIGGPVQELLGRLEEINRRLAESEERRGEDRDRLLMALLRTQQEIGHLRGELAAVTPRRSRRRLWWWRQG
jgi:hypothetical protein